MAQAEQLPELIIVGIGYSGDNLRDLDYYALPDKFLEFMTTELFPLSTRTVQPLPRRRCLRAGNDALSHAR
jgi:hypothetical protein